MNKNKQYKRIISILVLLSVILAVAYFLSDGEKKMLDAETRAELPGQFVDLPQGVVHYELTGPEDAPVVVLVHGFSVPYYVWDPTFEVLTDAGFRVLRYDLYGRGYSDRPEVEYDLDLFIGQLQDLLIALDISQPVTLVGLSFGGPVVARFANQYPQMVHGMVLIDPQVARVSAGDIFPLNLPLVGEYIMSVYMAPVMLPGSQADDFYRPERFPDWEAEYRLQLEFSGFKRAILSTIRNMVDMQPLEEYRMLGGRDLPVMLLRGREDKTISTVDIERVREAIPQAEFHLIPEAGHLPQYEQPEEVGALLVNFLDRIERK